eukprot:s1389_g13.t1
MTRNTVPDGDVDLNYRDHCLIIVGDGRAADELLCRRRLKAGGRLAHFLFLSEDQVKISGEEPDVIFAWQPLYGAPCSSLQRKLGPSMETFATKTGPDCIALQPEQILEIFTRHGRMRLVRLVESGRVLLEMSGEVILKPDEDLAKNLDIEVEDPELRAFGTYSKRSLSLLLPAMLIWHVIKLFVSMTFERSANGEPPWWRGLLISANGFGCCIGGIWKNCAASLSGEYDLGLTHKIFSCACILPVVMVATAVNVATLPATLLGGSVIFLSGPLLQFYQTRSKYPERKFLPCLFWAVANFSATLGIGICLCAIVVTYGLLLVDYPAAASLFLPISTALLESITVTFTRFMYMKMVVQKRPMVPGDISYVSIPFMFTALHGLSEGARLIGIFSGAVTSGQYAWVSSVALTLLINVMVRTGWTRLCCFFAFKYTIGLSRALSLCAPTAYSKLHDETKIYVGYFRFPPILALIFARALVYQDLTFSQPLSASYNDSALLALICMMVTEFLEDYIVVKQIVPMSPVVADFIENELQRKSRHASLVSFAIHMHGHFCVAGMAFGDMRRAFV